MLKENVGAKTYSHVNNEEPSTKPFDVNSVTIEDRNHQNAHKKWGNNCSEKCSKNTFKWKL